MENVKGVKPQRQKGTKIMKYEDAKVWALSCISYAEVKELLKTIELDENITTRQYYYLKSLAIESVYEYQAVTFTK